MKLNINDNFVNDIKDTYHINDYNDLKSFYHDTQTILSKLYSLEEKYNNVGFIEFDNDKFNNEVCECLNVKNELLKNDLLTIIDDDDDVIEVINNLSHEVHMLSNIVNDYICKIERT